MSAPAFVGSAVHYAAGGVADSVSLSRPAGVEAGDLLLAQVFTTHSTGVTAPSGWDLLRADGTGTSSSDRKSLIYARRASGSEPTTYTWPKSDTAAHGALVLVYRNAAIPTVTGAMPTTTGTTVTAPAITTPGAGSRVVAMYGHDTAKDMSTPAGTTERATTRSGTTNRLIVAAFDYVHPASSNTGDKVSIADGFSRANVGTHVAVVAFNSPPNAPIVTVPAVVNRLQPVVVGVQFSDPDAGDSSSATRLRYRRTDVVEAWAEVYIEQPVSQVTIPAPLAEAPYEVQARSTDSQGEVGPWSGSEHFEARTPPSAPTITDPVQGSTIPSETVTVTVSATTLDVLDWQAVIDGTVHQSGSTSQSTARTFTVTDLPNGVNVTLRARIGRGGLFSDWTEQTHAVSYTKPPPPSLTVVGVDSGGYIAVAVTNPAPSGSEPQVTHVSLRRSDLPAGTRLNDPANPTQPLSIAPGGTHNDHRIASGAEVTYQAVAHGANGTTAVSDWTGG